MVNEVCVNLLRKPSYTESEVQQTIENFQVRYPIMMLTIENIQQASVLRTKYRLLYWDSVFIASAMDAGCSKVYSEDMQNGLKIGNLMINNPFLA